jgi:hypothetical protein
VAVVAQLDTPLIFLQLRALAKEFGYDRGVDRLNRGITTDGDQFSIGIRDHDPVLRARASTTRRTPGTFAHAPCPRAESHLPSPSEALFPRLEDKRDEGKTGKPTSDRSDLLAIVRA